MQPQADPFIVPPCFDDVTILFEDEHLLLINKPSGLLSLSGKHPLNKDSVHARLVQRFPSARLLHRLDFGTSGVMIVALNKVATTHISKQFQAGVINKNYTAVLHGQVPCDNGVIDLPITKNKERFPLQMICHTTGKAALTEYTVIERNREADTTRVAFKPLTGRTHQLRIHSRELGHPILGCDLYAFDDAFFMAQRLMLHATHIEFLHPVSGKSVHGISACPF